MKEYWRLLWAKSDPPHWMPRWVTPVVLIGAPLLFLALAIWAD